MKLETSLNKMFTDAINRNMRCIEMGSPERLLENYATINRNMRCIEIEKYLQKEKKNR